MNDDKMGLAQLQEIFGCKPERIRWWQEKKPVLLDARRYMRAIKNAKRRMKRKELAA